jgi:hypothetical protein
VDRILKGAKPTELSAVRPEDRGGTGAEFSILNLLVKGTVLNVLAFYNVAGGRWALVDLKGDGRKDGYMFAKFIDQVSL